MLRSCLLSPLGLGDPILLGRSGRIEVGNYRRHMLCGDRSDICRSIIECSHIAIIVPFSDGIKRYHTCSIYVVFSRTQCVECLKIFDIILMGCLHKCQMALA